MSKDYYKILGVDKGSSEDEIKKSFRRLAHEHHPDKGGDQQKFKDVNEAYQILGDKQKRAQYDQFGSAAFEQGGMGGPGGGFGGFGGFDGGQGFNINVDDLGDLGDMLGGMFGFGGRGPRQKRGHDLEAELRVSFLESIFGAQKDLTLYRHLQCAVCHGSGAEPGAAISKCKTCDGRGRVQQAQRTLLGTFNTVVSCPDCQGSGQRAEQSCKHCSGTGLEKKESVLHVNIPAGMEDGQALKITGEGEFPGKGGRSGDLYVRIRVAAHPEFKRQDQDVLSTIPVPFSILSLGGKIDVSTVDGPVVLKIPGGTTAGTVFKLRGKGVPSTNGYGRGDHLATLIPDVPKKLTKEQKSLLEQLGEHGL